MESEFLTSKFDRPGELFLFINGMLSRHSTGEVTARMRRVANEFADLHAADRALPLSERHGASMLLAIRPWEPRAFRALRRKDREPVPAGRLLNPMIDDGGVRAPVRQRKAPPTVALFATRGIEASDFAGAALPAPPGRRSVAFAGTCSHSIPR